MKNKKRIIIFSILLVLSVALVVFALFMPTVNLVAKDTYKTVVYNKNVSVVEYVKDSPFIKTDAFDVYFDATGPIYLATAGIMVNILSAVFGAVMFVVCALELALCWVKNVETRNNNLARKISLVAGYLSITLSVFSIVAYFVTTMMANGYVEFNFVYGPFVTLGLSVLIVVLAHISGKKQPNDQPNKAKNIVGFALTALFSAFAVVALFIPQFTADFLGPNNTSFYNVARQATALAADPYVSSIFGDVFFGLSQYVIFAVTIAGAFVFVYSIIGLILSACGKNVNFFSGSVKRWSMAFVIAYCVQYFLVFCQLGIIVSTIAFVDPIETIFFLAPYTFALMFVPILPYAFSTLVAYKRTKKEKANAQTIVAQPAQAPIKAQTIQQDVSQPQQ